MKLIVALHNIRSVYNVGAILRTSEGFGVDEVVYSGYTPRYNDTGLLPHLREKLNRQIEKSALGAEKLVKQIDLGKDEQRLLDWLEDSATKGYRIAGLENNLTELEKPRQVILGEQGVSFGEKVVLVLGEEVHGIPELVRAKMQYFLEIPMCGRKESFNVSVATGIALFALKCSAAHKNS